jgi:hypothetical protein
MASTTFDLCICVDFPIPNQSPPALVPVREMSAPILDLKKPTPAAEVQKEAEHTWICDLPSVALRTLLADPSRVGKR